MQKKRSNLKLNSSPLFSSPQKTVKNFSNCNPKLPFTFVSCAEHMQIPKPHFNVTSGNTRANVPSHASMYSISDIREKCTYFCIYYNEHWIHCKIEYALHDFYPPGSCALMSWSTLGNDRFPVGSAIVVISAIWADLSMKECTQTNGPLCVKSAVKPSQVRIY